MKLAPIIISVAFLCGCAKSPDYQQTNQPANSYKSELNQYDAYIAQARTLKDSSIARQQALLSNARLELEYKYKIILEKEKTKRAGIQSSKRKTNKTRYVIPKVCNDESAKEDDFDKDEVCAALKEMHNSLEDEYGEPEDYSGGVVINAQGASDFSINVQSHGNTNEGRKTIIEKKKSSLPTYAKRPLLPAIPQPPKGFWESFSDNLFGSLDNVVDKAANIVDKNADVIALGYVGGQLAKKPTTEIRGDLIGGDNNANRNDWQYEYTGAAEEIEIEE